MKKIQFQVLLYYTDWLDEASGMSLVLTLISPEGMYNDEHSSSIAPIGQTHSFSLPGAIVITIIDKVV